MAERALVRERSGTILRCRIGSKLRANVQRRAVNSTHAREIGTRKKIEKRRKGRDRTSKKKILGKKKTHAKQM